MARKRHGVISDAHTPTKLLGKGNSGIAWGLAFPDFWFMGFCLFPSWLPENYRKTTRVERVGEPGSPFLMKLKEQQPASPRSMTHPPTYNMPVTGFHGGRRGQFLISGPASPCTILVASLWGGGPVLGQMSGFTCVCFQSLPQYPRRSKNLILS